VKVINPLKILIADDEFLIRWSLSQALSQEGYEVVSVDNGRKAIEAAKIQQFDFIITDTKQTDQGQEAQVLVAATQRTAIVEPLSLLQQAMLDPHVITVDTFALYGLYSEIAAYKQRMEQ
jgi:DNA-binding NtrC family response regulator